jgi:hypothetical protein
MARSGTKDAAESVLRDLPSVLGAAVREDVRGNPREIHVLLSAGPVAGDFARDVRDLLEERLGIPIDQRVISVAQLAEDATWPEEGPRESPPARVPAAWPALAAVTAEDARTRLESLRTRLGGGRATVEVSLQWDGASHSAQVVEMEAGLGAPRAAARAALAAAQAACQGRVRLAAENVASVRAFERAYILVAATAAAPFLGRRPLTLSGAQPVGEDGAEWAAGLAALKAVNRVLARALRQHPAQPDR